MDNLTLISCSYNTPMVTENMLKTYLLYNNSEILISENSTNEETLKILESGNIPYIRNYGGLHGPSVDILLDSVKTDYVLLVDTDVLFHKSCSDIFESFVSMDLCLMGEIVGDRGGKRLHKRVNPWFCFINAEQVKENGIKFYDEVRMKSRNEVRYDVGSSFFEDIKKKSLRIADFNGNGSYYTHFEGMSWRTNKYNPKNGDTDIDNNPNGTHDNVDLYNYGIHIEQQYESYTRNLKSTKLWKP